MNTTTGAMGSLLPKLAVSVATGVMGSLLSKLVELLKDEYKLQTGVKEDIQFLKKELMSIQAALQKVGDVPRDQLDAQVRIWADEVRELSYNMEDVVDSLLVRVEGPELAANSHKLKQLMKKMGGLITKSKTRHQIANKIKDIKVRVKDVADQRERYRVDNIVSSPAAANTIDPRLLALYKDQKEIIGIKVAKEEVIRRLTEGDGDVPKQQLQALSIFGFGGLGKTTLAKAVYDDFPDQFDCGAFVSVGRIPDVKKVFKDILIELDKQRYMNFNASVLDEKQLIDELRGLLQNKRYFIVIDDVWEVNAWEVIKCAFVDSKNGSRLIITTRIFEVA